MNDTCTCKGKFIDGEDWRARAKALESELSHAASVLRDMTVGAPKSRAEQAAIHAETLLKDTRR